MNRVRQSDFRMIPMRIQVLSLDEFERVYAQHAADILTTKIIPPRLGEDGFGKVMIEWKNPTFVPAALAEFSTCM